MFEVLFDLMSAALGERIARTARPWVYGLGLVLLILVAAVLLRLAVG